jgi:hypothetical protein
VIAFNAGGAAEIVRADAAEPTGVFFLEQTAAAVLAAIEHFEEQPARWSAQACRENAMRFDRARFRQRFGQALRLHWDAFARERARAGAKR